MKHSEDQPPLKSSTAALAPSILAPINGAGPSEDLPLPLYACVLESVTDGVSVADDEGVIVYTNPAQARMFGYAPGELIGQHLSVLGITEVTQQLKTGGAWTGECLNKRKDGTEFHSFARLSTVELSGKRFFVCVQEDITARKELTDCYENARKLAEEAGVRLAAIVESSDDAIISKDLDGIIRSWNKGAERIFGYTAEEIIGKPVATLAVPERVEEIPNIIQRIRRGERVDHYETKRRTKDGRVLDISLTVSPIRNSAGEIVGASKVARDVTDQKRRFELQERLAAIVESSDDAIISKDLNGIIRSWNKGAERIFGYRAEEIIGKPVATLAVPERVEEIPNILERIRRGEHIDHYLTKRRTKDGRVLTISLTVSPIKDDAGNIIGASKVARDVTERERAEEMLRAANAALQRANADLEQFAYAAAHDLKEPLRMVSIYCQMLARDFNHVIGPDGQKYLQYSIEGARRMNALVQDLLAYVQASQLQTDVVSEAIDSNVALKHALTNLQVTIDESGASISAGNLPPVNMHEVHLEQIFQNLLGNAMKYRGSAAPEIVVDSKKAGSETVFSVKDNGIGIPAEYKEQIFELFKRLHPNERYSGSGIGLGICKRIVEHYGGRIWVESDVGRGSTFFFTVPTPGSAGGKQR